MRQASRRGLLLGLPALLAACQSSPNPVLYTLAPVSGTPRRGGPRTVVLREIALARYLERPNIVRSSESFQLDVMSNDWWGEPPGGMINRTLVVELSERLPGSTVLAESGAIGISPEAIVELNILRFDADRSGTVILRGQVAVTRPGGRQAPIARAVAIQAPPPSSGIMGQVAAMSAALGQLADQIADLLTGG